MFEATILTKRTEPGWTYRGMRKPLSTFIVTTSLALFAGGCEQNMADDDTLAEGDSEGDDFRNTVIGFGYCPPNLCGVNSDLAGSISFDSKGGIANAGMRLIASYTPDGEEINMRVIRADLELDPAEGETLVGEALVGSRFEFEDVETGELTYVYLDGYDANSLVSYNKPSITYSSYYFTYRHEDESEDMRRPLCGDFPWGEQNVDVGTIDPLNALMVQSEAYDWRGRPVEGEIDNFQWVTLGCMGGAYAKKVLMGYDPHHPAPEDTSLDENVTMLRMLTGRYCPEGDFNTVPGTPVYWQNDRGWQTNDPSVQTELEAIWGPEGAICLNTPRAVERSVIEGECSIPSCDGLDPSEYHLSSYRVLD